MSTFDVEEFFLPKPNFAYITRAEDVASVIAEILRHPMIEVDTETTGFDPYTKKIVLVQIGIPNKSFVFDVRSDTEHSTVHLDQLAPVLNNPKILKLLQNAVFDMKMLKVHAGYYLENIYDTMLVEQLFNLGVNAKGASLKDLVKKYLGLSMAKEPGGTFQDYNQVFKPYQIEYAANDVAILALIRELQLPRIHAEGFDNVCRLEFEFTKPMCEMELNGITLDKDKWRIMMKDIEQERDEAQEDINQLLSTDHGQNILFGIPVVNIDSPSQLLKALRTQGVKLDSTSAGSLEKYKDIPIIEKILSYRKLNKLMSTYGETLLEKIHPLTGRLHTRFRQMVQTGRMSSSAPNLQNIPKKQRFRSCFIAKPGYSLVTADMSGAELRILGNISEDAVFIECYANGIDLHTRTASEVFGIPMEEVKSDTRGKAKAINFGLCTSEHTEIITDSGIRPIKDVKINDSVAHDIGTNKVIDHMYMGEKEVFEVTTKYGYSIEVTSEHLMKVIDEGGNYTDKKLEDISMDKDSMCIKLGSNLFPKTNPIFEEFKVEKKTNYKDFRLPKILDNDWAAFLGLFVAEGSVFKVKGRDTYSTVGFGFSKKDCQFIEEIDKLFNRLFGDRFSRVDTGEFIRYTINSVIFAEWLVTMLNIKGINKTNEIKIPSCIKNSSKEVQSVFLSWLFEGDGTIKFNGKGYRIQYSSKSKPLMNDLQVMLLNFGILVSLKYEYRKGYPDKYYCLTIISYDCSSIFMNDIGFITDRKNNRANTTSAYRTSCYFIGAYRDKIEKIVENCDVSPQLKKRFHKKRYGDLIGNIYLEELAKYDEFFEFISTNKVVTLPIVSIKSKGLKRVYDISVDQHPYFIANGFIVHNCYGLSKYGLAARLKIKEKEADNMINTYFERYSGVKTYLEHAARGAVKNGFSQTISGRKRYYNIPPYGHPDRVTKQRAVERAAKNAGIQGANADTVKEAMILVVERLANSEYDAKLLLTVHDEVVVEVRDDQVEEVRELVANSLIDGFGKYFSKITMETDALLGPCWLKGSCENKIDGEECGCCDMEFVNDAHYGTKLVCAKCGAPQE